MQDDAANRNNKDRLFRFIFGREENKAFETIPYGSSGGGEIYVFERIQ